jgi:hypothetical protein
MKHSLVGFAVVALSLQASAAAPASYTIVDLGADQQPLGANDAGTVVGYTISTHTPVAYVGGMWTALPHTGTSGEATAVNAQGVICGFDGQIVEWVGGKRQRLQGTEDGKALGIADDGSIVGDYWGGSEMYAFKWKNGGKADLDFDYVVAIDSTATYVGGNRSVGEYHAWLQTGGQAPVDLGALNDPSGMSVMVAVNRNGHAAVNSKFDASGTTAAAYWNGTQLVDIGLHDHGKSSHAMAMNDGDDVLVTGKDGQGHHLFLYAGATGVATAIEPLIANPDGWTFDGKLSKQLAALTGNGTIYGSAYLNGVRHAFKLVPGGQ